MYFLNFVKKWFKMFSVDTTSDLHIYVARDIDAAFYVGIDFVMADKPI